MSESVNKQVSSYGSRRERLLKTTVTCNVHDPAVDKRVQVQWLNMVIPVESRLKLTIRGQVAVHSSAVPGRPEVNISTFAPVADDNVLGSSRHADECVVLRWVVVGVKVNDAYID